MKNILNKNFFKDPKMPYRIIFIIGLGLAILFLKSMPWHETLRYYSETSDIFSQNLKPESLPVRGDVRPLEFHRSDFTYQCNECHRSFLTPHGRRQGVAERHYIKFEHGNNDYCFNCHHRTNREAYVAYDGSQIPADAPNLLCSKCHGLVYRDWQIGAHGRRLGFWNTALDDTKQVHCIQCHDPHTPKFEDLSPMPGPFHEHRQAKRGTP